MAETEQSASILRILTVGINFIALLFFAVLAVDSGNALRWFIVWATFINCTYGIAAPSAPLPTPSSYHFMRLIRAMVIGNSIVFMAFTPVVPSGPAMWLPALLFAIRTKINCAGVPARSEKMERTRVKKARKPVNVEGMLAAISVMVNLPLFVFFVFIALVKHEFIALIFAVPAMFNSAFALSPPPPTRDPQFEVWWWLRWLMFASNFGNLLGVIFSPLFLLAILPPVLLGILRSPKLAGAEADALETSRTMEAVLPQPNKASVFSGVDTALEFAAAGYIFGFSVLAFLGYVLFRYGMRYAFGETISNRQMNHVVIFAVIAAILLLCSYVCSSVAKMRARKIVMNLFEFSSERLSELENNTFSGDKFDDLMGEGLLEYGRRHEGDLAQLVVKYDQAMMGIFGLSPEASALSRTLLLGRVMIPEAILWHREGLDPVHVARTRHDKAMRFPTRFVMTLYKERIKPGEKAQKPPVEWFIRRY